MTSAGRNDRATQEFATVDWMAYQGAPGGGVSGKTACRNGGLEQNARKLHFHRQELN